jgi:hypothetical protein
MPEPLDHYRAIMTALARLAGTHRSGRLPEQLTQQFPVDMQAATVDDRVPLSTEKLHWRLIRLAEFTQTHPALLPPNVRSPRFISRLLDEAPRLLAHEPALWRHLADHPDYIALCHWNANVDNAWFWRDAENRLQCGLMDWGCVSQMNMAMAIWGAMSGAETDMWNNHLHHLLQIFVAEVRCSGGPQLSAGELRAQIVLYAAMMGVNWLLEVPALIRARFGDAAKRMSRTDAHIRDDEAVRAPLQMLANVLNLWATHPVGQLLDGLSGKPYIDTHQVTGSS